MKKIGIIGAGISGLVLACFLKQNTDYNISIFEKDEIETKNINGIQISPNAVRILKKLNFGLFDQRKLCKIKGLTFYDYNSSSIIARMNFNFLDNDDYITLNRNELINFLIRTFSLKNQIIKKEVTKISGKSIFFKNNEYENFDILIIADGIFSKLRHQKIHPVYSGYSAFRGIFSDDMQKNEIDLWMGKNFHFVKYPVNQNKNYSFVIVKKMSLINDKFDYNSNFRNYNKLNKISLPTINNISFEDIDIKIWPIYKINKIFYGDGEIFFIGDSAHGFVPSRAQGAAQAIEDAYTLFNLISKNNISSKKLYELRKVRIKKIIKKSDNNIIIFHLAFLPLRWIRNFLIKLICSSKYFVKFINSYIFDYDVTKILK